MLKKLSVIALLLLCGCVINAAPSVKPQEPIVHSLPTPVWPDACVADWYAKTSLPPCVEAWITDITKEQRSIEGKHKKKLTRKQTHMLTLIH